MEPVGDGNAPAHPAGSVINADYPVDFISEINYRGVELAKRQELLDSIRLEFTE